MIIANPKPIKDSINAPPKLIPTGITKAKDGLASTLL